MPNPSRLRIGVFIPNGAQLLDVTPIDLFGMLSPTYLEVTPLPAPLKALGIPITIHYIGLATPTSKYAELTASAFLLLTNTIADKEVQPGQLDVLLIPGPEPSSTFASEALEFIRGHAGKEGTDVLSICTGCLLLAASGVLKGKQASGPRGLVSDLRKKYPDTKWDESRRWVQDGNIWSSGELISSLGVSQYRKELHLCRCSLYHVC